MQDAEEQKARRKEMHRRSMIFTGGMISAAGLAAAWIAFAPRGFFPSMRLSSKPAPAPDLAPVAATMRLRWQGFSPETLALAQRHDRLILLSLWAAWSAPCRLMDRTAYADERVEQLTRNRVVAVRVDADERPDLALRYLGDGWPTTALLLPTGEVLDSGTFMSADVLLKWVEVLADKFHARRAGVIEAAQDSAQKRRQRVASPAGVAAEVLLRARQAIERGWERDRQPRFARFGRLAALTRLRADWVAAALRAGGAVALALEDPETGGFRRSAGPGERQDAEKLLGIQADAVAYLSTSDLAAADRTRRFVERVLTDDSGGYFGSLAADGLVDRRRFGDENGRMAAAILRDRGASAAQKRHARLTIDRWWRARARGLSMRRLDGGARGLLGDQLGLLEALLADRRLAQALQLAAAIEGELLDEKGEAFYDRPAARELPEDLDRIRFAHLNARAWRLYEALGQRKRAQALERWLWTHSEGLDAADLAELAVRRLPASN